MKNLVILISALFISNIVVAQKAVKVIINHKINGNAFSLNAETQNSLGNKLTFTRVEYYLSNFKIVHDGGTETIIKDKYFLVDASNPVDLDLGILDVTSIEKLIFSVGVDKEKNHLDPASYDPSHALAPKSPSMHWGWASGYRFVALEGKTDKDLSNIWELHSLGDDFYYTIYLPTKAVESGSNLLLTINADYTKALSKIDVSGGIIIHGEENQDLIVLDNFRDSVFSNTDGLLKLEEVSLDQYKVYPNPSANGQFNLSNDLIKDASSIKVFDLLGKEVKTLNREGAIENFEISNNGIYFLQVTLKDNTVYSQKLLVNK